MFPPSRILRIFGNLEAIYALHCKFLRELELAYNQNAPENSCVGTAFLRNVSVHKIDPIPFSFLFIFPKIFFDIFQLFIYFVVSKIRLSMKVKLRLYEAQISAMVY